MSSDNHQDVNAGLESTERRDAGLAAKIALPASAILLGLGRNMILRGIVEMMIGIMLLFNPQGASTVLTIVIGALLISDGIVMALIALRANDSDRNWTVVNAFALLVVGVVTVCSPLVMEKLWMIALGVWQIACVVTSFFNGGWRRLWAVLSGVLSLVIGIIFITLPFVGLTAMCIIAGCVISASGFFTICAGADLRIAGRED